MVINVEQRGYGILASYRYYPDMIDIVISPTGKKEDHCFMIGGSTSGIDKYYKKILAKCKENNVKTTVFYVQDSWLNTSDVLYDRKNDTVYVATSKDIKNVQDLKNYYSYIEIADGDEVYINDKKVEL